jgi:ketosteroid isomerase-like protein
VNRPLINAPISFGWHHAHGVGGSEKTLVEEDKAPVSEVQEKNKALVRRFLEAQDKGDLDAVKEMMAPHFVDHSALPGQAPNREDYIRDLTDDQAAFSNFRYIIEDQAAEGDKVISRCTISAIHDRGGDLPWP